MHDEDWGHEEGHHHHHMDGPMKKEFKLAMLEKRQRILEAELDFVKKMKDLVSDSDNKG